METLGNGIGAKTGKNGQYKYYCEKCHYSCCKKYDWNRHILTSKHNKEILGTELEIKNGQNGQNGQIYNCIICEKNFKTNAGLWKHKKNCNKPQQQEQKQDKEKGEPTDKELFMMLINQNKELLEIVKNGTPL